MHWPLGSHESSCRWLAFRAEQSVIVVVEVPDSAQWARIRRNWGDPGYVVCARTEDHWLVPFESLNMTVGVRARDGVVPISRAEYSPYAISSNSTDCGVAFKAGVGERLQVTLTSNASALPDGLLVIEPFWGFARKDQLVGGMLEHDLRHYLAVAAAIGLIVAVGSVVLLRRASN